MCVRAKVNTLVVRPAEWLQSDLFAIWESTETSSTQRQDVMIAGVKLVVLY
jgi:hypothetical protein